MDEDISPVAELLGQAIYHFERLQPLLPTYGHLIVAALFPIWIGAHASLSRPSSAAKALEKKDFEDIQTASDDSDDESGPDQKMEGLEPSDALIFPVTAGLTLGGLYLVIKWLEDPAILNKILSFYFSGMGVFFAVAFLKDFLMMSRSFMLPRRYKSAGKLWVVSQSRQIFIARSTNGADTTQAVRQSPLPGIFGAIPLPRPVMSLLWTTRNVCYQRLQVRAHVRGILNVKILVGLLDLLSAIFAFVAVGYFAFVQKPWWLTNFLGFSFSYGTLQFMSPSTFWTGSLILSSLFFYDIYFVFFTPMMVTVATKLDVPIKLLFPRPPSPGDESNVQSLAMLGLGDIVVPGMMIGLALRFDLFLYYYRKGIESAHLQGLADESVKPQYQRATGAWGERFWASAAKPQTPELTPPYSDARSFPKVYFKASVIGYIIGMVTTLLAMQYSNHAQPALLYLVPGVLISLWGTAFFRGETSIMWNFSDTEADEDPDAENQSKEEDAAKAGSDLSKLGEQKGLISRIFSGDVSHLAISSKNDESMMAKEKKREASSEGTLSANPVSDSHLTKDAKSKEQQDLVSFSISFPEKPEGKKGGAQEEEADPVVAISEAGEQLDEPPLKRRRGTPRKPVAR